MEKPQSTRPRRASGPRSDDVVSLAAFRAAASVFAERLSFGSRAGLTFSGERDLYEALGYARNLRPQDYRDRYDRGGLAKRIVTIYPRATWRGGVELVENGNPKELTTFEEAWRSLSKRLGVAAVLERADTLARLGRYSIVLIGAAGNAAEPLPKKLGPDGVVYLAPYGEFHITINATDIENDPASPRWGLPQFYTFNPIGVTDAPGIVSTAAPTSGGLTRIHWTRVVHLAEAPLENPLYGEAALADVWNYLDDLEKVVGGGAEAFWIRANPGLNLNMDPTLPLDPTAIGKLEEQVDKYLHRYRRTLQTRGVEVKQLGADVASIGEDIKALVSLIAATKSIPQRILLGSERGELASGQDDSEWREKVQDRRGSYAEPVALRPLADRLIEHGALPLPVRPEGYEVRWSEWRDLSIEERVTLAGKLAAVNQAHAAARPGEIVVTADEIRERTLDLDPLADVAPEEVATGLDNSPPEDDEEDSAVVRPFPAARQRGGLRRRGAGSSGSPTGGSGRSGT